MITCWWELLARLDFDGPGSALSVARRFIGIFIPHFWICCLYRSIRWKGCKHFSQVCFGFSACIFLCLYSPCFWAKLLSHLSHWNLCFLSILTFGKSRWQLQYLIGTMTKLNTGVSVNSTRYDKLLTSSTKSKASRTFQTSHCVTSQTRGHGWPY